MTTPMHPSTPSPRQRIRLPDSTISCTVTGAGEPVVLLHGWPQTSHAWRHVIPLLAARCTVIALDMPGFGDGTRSAGGFDRCLTSSLSEARHMNLDQPRLIILEDRR